MLVLKGLLGSNSKQSGVATEFLHADIPDNEKVYVEITRGFNQFSNNVRKKCLKLKKTPYGLRKITRTF